MAIFDIAFINAEIHYYMVNPERKKVRSSRYKFWDSVAESFLSTEWSIYDNGSTSDLNEIFVKAKTEVFDDEKDTTQRNSTTEIKKDSTPVCSPIKPRNKSQDGRLCQVCKFEERHRSTRDVMMCKAHCIRACITVPNSTPNISENIDTSSWMAPESMIDNNGNTITATCWEKLHNYYLSRGLFGSLIPNVNEDGRKGVNRIHTTSDIYNKKQECLGKCIVRKGRKRGQLDSTKRRRRTKMEMNHMLEVEQSPSSSQTSHEP